MLFLYFSFFHCLSFVYLIVFFVLYYWFGAAVFWRRALTVSQLLCKTVLLYSWRICSDYWYLFLRLQLYRTVCPRTLCDVYAVVHFNCFYTATSVRCRTCLIHVGVSLYSAFAGFLYYLRGNGIQGLIKAALLQIVTRATDSQLRQSSFCKF